MLHKTSLILFRLAVCVGTIFVVSNECALAQRSKTQPSGKDFGWSLKKFEKRVGSSSKNEQPDQRSPEQVEVSDDEIIHVETNLVINDVLVVNEKGNAVLGLKQNDLTITEDGEPQKIEMFSFGETAALPRSIVLILRSVPKNDYAWTKNALAAAKALVDKLAPRDRVAIVTTDMKVALDFERDKNLLKKTLDKVFSGRIADFLVLRDYGTLMAVLNEMFDEEDVRPIVISLASGSEFFYLKGEFPKLVAESLNFFGQSYEQSYKRRFGGERAYSFDDVLAEVEKSRATIYSIVPTMRFVGLPREEQLRRARIDVEETWRLGVKERDPSRISAAQDKHQQLAVEEGLKLQTAAMRVARLSGGYTEFVEQPEDAQRVYETIFTVINNRYTIGYYSTNQTGSRKRRNIKIEVRDHPEYTVVGRKTYLPR